ncbi:MAG: hypothetical protein PHN19_05615 [Patescibacteria group bacterium]|nr:hypothetical protein [Patescibacteria group bacterium]
MDEETKAADQRIMDGTTIKVSARQNKSSQGARSQVIEVPLWKIRATRRAEPALAVYGD